MTNKETDRTPTPLATSPLESHFRDIVDSLPDGVITVDREWKITTMNHAAQSLLGAKEQEVLGRFCYQVVRGDCCRNDCPLGITLETGNCVRDFEIHATGLRGEERTLAVNTAVLRDADGTPMGGVISFRDRTLEKRLEEDLLGETHFHGIVGRSRPMRELFDLIREVAECDATVLIEGESGTGKELVAKAIQRLSPRKDRPFVRVNCAAFVETLLESELFGHVRGAFTDAHTDRPGRFEMADGGTIFLDEIGEASPAVQTRLLRVLQEREFERVGGNETIPVNVRVIAATNRPLHALVAQSRFRDDLYYRLNVFPVPLPPLRERPEDVIPLVNYFLERRRFVDGRKTQVSPRALTKLVDHSWPGNVRELENSLEYASVRCHGSTVQCRHLPPSICGGEGEAGDEPPKSREAEEILIALQESHWNRAEAARRLSMSRTTLWRRMIKLGLHDR